MTGLKNYLQQQMSLGTKKNSSQKTDTGSERCDSSVDPSAVSLIRNGFSKLEIFGSNHHHFHARSQCSGTTEQSVKHGGDSITVSPVRF